MYPRFIEVHTDGRPVMINTDRIELIADKTIQTTTCEFCVSESFVELQQLIQNAGASISKGDPRLDTVHPLTIADLQGMLGEPVWNSNLMRWGLVKEITEDTAVLVYQAADWVIVDANDLVKFPLYRMKQ